jgi:hypothetical protein
MDNSTLRDCAFAVFGLLLGASAAVVVYIRMQAIRAALLKENALLRKKVEELALEVDRLTGELLARQSQGSGTLEKAISILVGLGVPGLVLAGVIAASGFAGAAAITSSLATLGGPLGMLGGIGALIGLALASRAIAEYGLPRIGPLIVDGLLSKGKSRESIAVEIQSFPLISQHVRTNLLQLLPPANNAPPRTFHSRCPQCFYDVSPDATRCSVCGCTRDSWPRTRT